MIAYLNKFTESDAYYHLCKFKDKVGYLVLCSFLAAGFLSLRDLPDLITTARANSMPHPVILTAGSVNNIKQASLFGVPPQAPDSSSQFSAEIAKLSLKGIMFSTDIKAARAIISYEGTEKIYKTGDNLSANILLAELYADKIILKQADKAETVYLTPRH